MANRLTRPVYILTHPADQAGCGHHRITRPLEILARHGYAAGRSDMQLWLDDRLKALNPDIIVWQRQFEDNQIEAIKKSRGLCPKAFCVYELDDCMSAVPPWSPHLPAIPYGIDDRMALAVAACDAVSVSTKELADHMREVCAPGTDIRIIPNMLAKEEIERVEEIRNMKPPGRGRLRIGWGGGHSHKADLDIVIPAMRALHHKADFVFLGQEPECEVPHEFHAGVPPTDFLPTLAGLGIDLFMAPLVDNKFNRCKSNLRLLEAAAIGAPVIASPVAPYLTNNPPVFYAEDETDWVVKLADFIQNPDVFRPKGDSLKQWMKRHYLMDDKLEERLQAWLPKGTKPFIPKRQKSATSAVVVCSGGKRNDVSKYDCFKTLQEACERSTSDIVYIRDNTIISDEQISRLMRTLNHGDTASVVPLSNDGGVAGFPRFGQFTTVDAARFGGVDELCKRLFGPVRAEISNPAGPVMVLSRRVMELCGYPDHGLSDPEAALVEWGVMVAAKGFTNVASADTYVSTTDGHVVDDAQMLLMRCQLRYQIKQLQQDPLADMRQELELAYHREFYNNPLPSANVSYAEWSALFNELDERDLNWMEAHFPDVKIVSMAYPVIPEDLRADVDKGIEWAIFVSASTALVPQAAYIFAKAIEEGNSDALLFYADHDFQLADGTHDRHDFKPHRFDWHLLLQRDYVTPVFAVHLPTLLAVSEQLPDLIMEPTLYGLILDLVKQFGPERVVHVPRVLAHLADEKPLDVVNKVQEKAAEAQKRVEKDGILVSPNVRFPYLGFISYVGAVPDPAPLVSVIIGTTGKTEILSPGLGTLLALTDYPNFEVLLVVNNVKDPKCDDYLKTVETDPRVRVLRYSGGYNYSAINNWAAKQAKGEYLLLLNDDTRVTYPSWLREMVGAAQRPDVGAVGARLLYPHGLIQHIGVVARAGLTGHLMKGMPESNVGYNGIAILSHEATAVTGACMLIRKSLFDELRGLDEKLAHNFNDVKLCLELNREGYHNLVVAAAELQHIEGITRHKPDSREGEKLILSEGARLQKEFQEPDPYWNPNLVFTHSHGGIYVMGLNYDILAWPPAAWPHRDEDWPRETVLMVGDNGSGWVAEAKRGNTVYSAALQGFAMQIVRPTLSNVAPFDVRESVMPTMVVTKLGINKIVVRSILGGGAEVLPFLLKLGLPVEYQPLTPESVCPRLDFKTLAPDGTFKDCEGGWRRGVCQNCLVSSGSPFGVVSVTGWREQFHRFLEKADGITAQSEGVAQVMADIYPEIKDEARAAAE